MDDVIITPTSDLFIVALWSAPENETAPLVARSLPNNAPLYPYDAQNKGIRAR